MTPLTYRALLIASVAIGISSALLDTVFPSALPAAFVQAQEAQDGALTTLNILVGGIGGLVLSVIGLASIVGLYLFRPWAPRLAVVTTALALPLISLLGATAISGYAMALSEISSTLWGAVLAISYFSPLKNCFVQTDR